MPAARRSPEPAPLRTTLRGRRNRFTWSDALSRSLRLEADQRQDGRLVDLSIAMSRRGSKAAVEATLRVDVYGEGTHARRRTPLTARFGGVREVVSTVNCAELVELGDSHIVFARLNDTSEMLDLSSVTTRLSRLGRRGGRGAGRRPVLVWPFGVRANTGEAGAVRADAASAGGRPAPEQGVSPSRR